MQLKRFIFGLMAMLALLVGVQQPLLAAKNVEKEKRYKQSSSSSSSHHHKKKKCCKEVLELVQQIDQTTVQDLIG